MKTNLFRFVSLFVILAIACSIATPVLAAGPTPTPAPKFYYPYQKETAPTSHAWLEVKSNCFIPPVNFGYCEGKKVTIFNHGPKMATIQMKGNVYTINNRQTIEIAWTEPFSIELDTETKTPDLSKFYKDKVGLKVWDWKQNKVLDTYIILYHRGCFLQEAADNFGVELLPHCDWRELFISAPEIPIYIEKDNEPFLRINEKPTRILWKWGMSLSATGRYVHLRSYMYGVNDFMIGGIFNPNGSKEIFYYNFGPQYMCRFSTETKVVFDCLKPGDWAKFPVGSKIDYAEPEFLPSPQFTWKTPKPN